MKTKNTQNISSSLFNSVIIAYAIVSADEIGLLKSLYDGRTVNIADFCSRNGIQEYPLRTFCRALSLYDIVSFRGKGSITKGKNFVEIFSNKGYFTWLLKGYSYALENMTGLLEAKSLEISNVKRDGAYIALAGKDYGENFVNSYFDKAFKEVNPKSVLDIGCGSADRLIRIAKSNTGIKCIGIETNKDAVKVARKNIKDANVEKNIEIICADINALAYDPRFDDIDTVISFFMAHDLWPKENCYRVFSNLRKALPNVKNFLLCDTYKSVAKPNDSIFTIGFELTHAFMGQIIPTRSDWTELFKELDWKLAKTIDIGIPNSTIFQLKID